MTTTTTDELPIAQEGSPLEPAETTPKKPAYLRVRKPPMGLLVAVEARCLECVGTDRRDLDGRDRIIDCRATGCPLHPVRPGQRVTRETLWPAIRAKCRRCQGPDPGVELRIATCEVPTCPLRPVREYRADETGQLGSFRGEIAVGRGVGPGSPPRTSEPAQNMLVGTAPDGDQGTLLASGGEI